MFGRTISRWLTKRPSTLHAAIIEDCSLSAQLKALHAQQRIYLLEQKQAREKRKLKKLLKSVRTKSPAGKISH